MWGIPAVLIALLISAPARGQAPVPAPAPTPATAPSSIPNSISNSVSGSGSVSNSPPGTWVYGNYKAWYIGTGTDLVVVRDTAFEKPTNAIDLSYVEPSLLRRFLTFKYANFLPFGEQQPLERAIDAACRMQKETPGKLNTRTIEDVAREFLGDYGADAMLKHPDKNTPYFVGAVLSALTKPEKIVAADSPVKFNVVAAVASCKEAAGSRFRLAQKRSFNTQVTNNVRALTWLIEKWIVSRVTEDSDDAARDELKAKSLATSIKAIRLSLAKMREYQTWLQGPEGKQLGGGVIWDAPLVPRAQEYTRGLTQLLERQLTSLEREYQSGQARNPKTFAKLESDAVLQDKDLDLLLASP